MLNLRHLVVCLDPYSDTSPNKIAERWNKQGMMQIDVWNETDFEYLSKKENVTQQMQIELHRRRQMRCYTDCLKHLNAFNRTWTMMIDVDEFISFNPVIDDGSLVKIDIGEKHIAYEKIDDSDPNSNYKVIKTLKKRTSPNPISNPNRYRIEVLMNMRLKVPRSAYQSNKTIAQFITEGKNTIPFHETCVVLPRLQFGNVVKSKNLKLQEGVSVDFAANRFNTLKYFSHHKNIGNPVNGAGKSIVDVSKMKTYKVENVHMINSECGNSKQAAFADHATSLLRVNHYLMPKELYFSKLHHSLHENEKYNKFKTYEYRASVNYSQSYGMEGWLELFVNEVGTRKAKILLHGAGVLDNRQSIENEA